jgi:hypothetical protein
MSNKKNPFEKIIENGLIKLQKEIIKNPEIVNTKLFLEIGLNIFGFNVNELKIKQIKQIKITDDNCIAKLKSGKQCINKKIDNILLCRVHNQSNPFGNINIENNIENNIKNNK